MPQIRLIGTLVVSVALIGGALWFRYIRIAPYNADVNSLSLVEPLPVEVDMLLKDFYSASTSPQVTSTEELSQSDLLGRQLLSDYLELKSEGQATPENIATFSTSLAESVKNIDVSISKIDFKQIIVVTESEVNLATYGNTVTNLHDKYKNLVSAQTKNSGSDITNTESPAFSIFMGEAGKLYQAAADELLLVGVPSTLAQNHLDLINQYLENAAVMKLISQASKDPLQAYASLNIYITNSGRESELLIKIQKTLQAHGIIFNIP